MNLKESMMCSSQQIRSINKPEARTLVRNQKMKNLINSENSYSLAELSGSEI
jgi:hypothetical protein